MFADITHKIIEILIENIHIVLEHNFNDNQNHKKKYILVSNECF